LGSVWAGAPSATVAFFSSTPSFCSADAGASSSATKVQQQINICIENCSFIVQLKVVSQFFLFLCSTLEDVPGGNLGGRPNSSISRRSLSAHASPGLSSRETLTKKKHKKKWRGEVNKFKTQKREREKDRESTLMGIPVQ
jgi:hypothetical protein